jgi:hypothetical protein
MRRLMFLVSIILLFALIVPEASFPQALVLYDDFSGTYIDKNKWREGETVREIRDFTGNNKLLFKTVTPSPVLMTSFPYNWRNNLGFSNPDSINSIQAGVTVLESNATGSARTYAGLGGRFYNDGSLGGGYAGDIWAEVDIRGTSTGLIALYAIGKYTTADGSTLSWLALGVFVTAINPETTYTLYIEYNSFTNQFVFKVGSETITLDPSVLPARVGNASMPYKGLLTLARAYSAAESASISVTFDDVYVNGLAYDDFSISPLSSAKWNDCEFVREVSGGKFRSKMRSTSPYTSYNNVLEFIPMSINNFQAKVTLVDYQNPQGRYELADISGTFYNDGTPGGGLIGDVVGEVLIGGTELNPVAGWRAYKYTDTPGNSYQVLASGTFTTPITLENVYTLFLGWNANRFTFKFDSEEASYAPVGTINPANVAFKRLRTYIHPDVGEGTIEALFDDVLVNGATLTTAVLPAGGGSIDLNPPGGTYNLGTVVTLTANPAGGYQFDHWEGNLTGSTNPAQITMDGDKTVTASFVCPAPIIQNMAFKGCISELCTSPIQVVASDPCGGSLTYNYEPLDGGNIIGSGPSVAFAPPPIYPGYPCPHHVKVTVTSLKSGLLISQTIGIYVKISGDINGDGKVNATDKLLWRKQLGWAGTPGAIPEDINCDGKVDATDQSILSSKLGLGWGCVCK